MSPESKITPPPFVPESIEDGRIRWQRLTPENAEATARRVGDLFARAEGICYQRFRAISGVLVVENVLAQSGLIVNIKVQFDTDERIHPHWVSVRFSEGDPSSPHYLTINKGQKFAISEGGPFPFLAVMEFPYKFGDVEKAIADYPEIFVVGNSVYDIYTAIS